ncbi:hypothetical protein MKX83_24055 [Cytobacillus sp. FSL M8-0252]|uniref:hypothetical protein n=1 Tax=Cytobacillus sp. FSL M8-0252 TaxID=2921621 RepID=UPI0030FA22FC
MENKELIEYLDSKFKAINERFDKVDNRFENIDTKLSSMNEKLDLLLSDQPNDIHAMLVTIMKQTRNFNKDIEFLVEKVSKLEMMTNRYQQ